MEPELIETLFDDPSEFVRFLVGLREAGKSTSDGNCIALLKKDTPEKWSYTLMLVGGPFIGDYLIPFKPSKENYAIFNEGCRRMARRFRLTWKLETRTKYRVSRLLSVLSPIPKATMIDLEEDQTWQLWASLPRTDTEISTGGMSVQEVIHGRETKAVYPRV